MKNIKVFIASFVLVVLLFANQTHANEVVRPFNDGAKNIVSLLTNKKEKNFDKEELKQVRSGVNIKDYYDELGYPPNQQSIITDMTLTFKDKDGNEITEPTISSILDFSVKFEIPENVKEKIKAGDFYEFQLADTVKIAKEQVYNLNGYASVTISTDGKVTITFNEKVQEESEIKGEFHFSGNFDEAEVTDPGEVVVNPPGEEEINLPPVIIKPEVESSIDKNGFFDKVPNPNTITWNIDFNKSMDTIEDATLTEVFPDGVEYVSVVLYKVKVDLKGNVIPGSETPATVNYSVDADGKITFNEPISDAYRAVYTTKIKEDVKPGGEGGTLSFKNKAILGGSNIADIPAEASVSTMYNKMLDKTNTGYDKDKQELEWKIKYNYTEYNIKESQAKIKDKLGAGLELIAGSVELHKITFDVDGKPVKGALLEDGTDYNIVETADGFEIEFIGDVNYAVDIDYKTKVTVIIDENTEFANTVNVETGETSTEGGKVDQQGFIKSVTDVDYKDEILSWKIEINKNNYTMKNWKMKDTLSKGLIFIRSSYEMYDVTSNKKLNQGVDYKLDYDEKTQEISVELINDYLTTDHELKFTYKTGFDPDLLQEGESFRNTASSSWESEDGEKHNTNQDIPFKPNADAQNNGFKNGEYNAVTKEITWSIGVNYSSEELKQAHLIDPITGNQKFVPGSIKLYHYTINPDGSIKKGEELTPTEYALHVIYEPTDEYNQVAVHFGNVTSGSRIIVEFKTSLEGQVVEPSKTYDNKAKFNNKQSQDHELDAKVSIANAGKFALKSGKQDDKGFAVWEVYVNPAQSTLKNMKMVDHPSKNQVLDEKSIEIYETNVAVNGKVTPDLTKPLDASKYNVSVTTDNVTGEQELVINFPGTTSVPYFVTYKSLVLLEKPSDVVTNKVTISGENDGNHEGGAPGEIEVTVNDGGGTATGVTGNINIKKVDESGKTLTGAKFTLSDKNDLQILREGTVDASGAITFGALPYGDYILREVEVPTGHTVPNDLISGRVITVSKDTSNVISFLNIVNETNKVILTKENEKSEKLAGAVFKVEKFESGSWVPAKGNETFKADSKGKVTVTGLLEGKYRFIETVAAPGYLLNEEPIEFDVVTTNNQTPTVNVGPFINYLGSAEMTKLNAKDNSPLQNAVFGIYDSKNVKVQEQTTDSTGLIKFTDLKPGVYTVKELTAPNGFIKNEEVKTITIKEKADGQPNAEQIGNYLNYQGSMKMYKKDKDNNVLANAVFELYNKKDNQLIDTLTSDAAGLISYDGLAPGTYILKEITAPNGFVVNTLPIEFTIMDSANGAPVIPSLNDFINYKGSFELIKVNGQNVKLTGAVFTIYDETGVTVGTATSDSLGFVKFDNLEPGDYTIKETTAPLDEDGNPYVLNEYPIKVTVPEKFEGKLETEQLGLFQNFKGKVEISKKGENGALANAVFEVYDIDGNMVLRIETGDDGILRYDTLPPGDYKFIETVAPPGFIINKNPIYVNVPTGSQGQPAVDFSDFMNYQGSVKLQKNQVNGTGLAGAKFSLARIEDENGNSINEVISKSIGTDANGLFYQKNLAPGKYIVKETTAPDGFVLNEKEFEFTIDSQIIGEPETEDLGALVNYTGSMVMKKTTEDNKALSGVSFQLMDADGKNIAVLTTDSNGQIKFDDLQPGKYSLKEIESPTGFILNTENADFEIPESANDGPVVIKVNNFINYQGSLEVTKVDKKSQNKRLKDAVFKLVDSKDKVVKNNLVSDVNGKISVNKIKPGTYYLIETKAPKGYELAKTKHKVVIVDDAKGKPATVKLLVTNKKKPGITGNLPIAGSDIALLSIIFVIASATIVVYKRKII